MNSSISQAQKRIFEGDRYTFDKLSRQLQQHAYRGFLGKRSFKVGFAKASRFQRVCHALFKGLSRDGRGWVKTVRFENRVMVVNRRSFDKFIHRISPSLKLSSQVQCLNTRIDALIDPENILWFREPLTLSQLIRARKELLSRNEEILPLTTSCDRHKYDSAKLPKNRNIQPLARYGAYIRQVREELNKPDSLIPKAILKERLKELIEFHENGPICAGLKADVDTTLNPFPVIEEQQPLQPTQEEPKDLLSMAIEAVETYALVPLKALPESLHTEFLMWRIFLHMDDLEVLLAKAQAEMTEVCQQLSKHEEKLKTTCRDIESINRNILILREKQKILPPGSTKRSLREIAIAREETLKRIQGAQQRKARNEEILLVTREEDQKRMRRSLIEENVRIIEEGSASLEALELEAQESQKHQETLALKQEALPELQTHGLTAREEQIQALRATENEIEEKLKRSDILAPLISNYKKEIRKLNDRAAKLANAYNLPIDRASFEAHFMGELHSHLNVEMARELGIAAENINNLGGAQKANQCARDLIKKLIEKQAEYDDVALSLRILNAPYEGATLGEAHPILGNVSRLQEDRLKLGFEISQIRASLARLAPKALDNTPLSFESIMERYQALKDPETNDNLSISRDSGLGSTDGSEANLSKSFEDPRVPSFDDLLERFKQIKNS